MARKILSAAAKKKEEDQTKLLATKEVVLYVRRSVLFWIERVAFFILTCFLLIRRCCNPNKSSFHPDLAPGLVVLFAAIVFFQGCFYVRYLHETRPETIGVRRAYNLMTSVLPRSAEPFDAVGNTESMVVLILFEIIVLSTTLSPSQSPTPYTWEPDLVLALASFAGLYIATNVTRFCLVVLIDNHDNGGGGEWRTSVLGEGDGGRAAETGDVRGNEEEVLLESWEEEVSLIRDELSEATAVVDYLRRRRAPSPS